MNKILLIIQREYLTRVRKKAFWIVSLLMPILITAIYAIPVLLFVNSDKSKTVQVIDESGLFEGKIKKTDDVTFDFVKENIETAKAKLKDSKADALAYIPKNILDDPKGLKIFSEKNVNLSLKNAIEDGIQTELRKIKLSQANIDLKIIEDSKVNVSASTFSLSESGKEKTSSAGVAMILSYFLAFLLYMTVFIYGSQVLNGVIEEKSSKVIEVIISSVRPIQLMMGKILGIGLVGLTQFVLWIALTAAISTATSGFLANKMQDRISQQVTKSMSSEEKKVIEAKIKAENPLAEWEKAKESLPLGQMIFGMFFYFLGGYLLYSALFAAVGSAVDSVTDAQQFMWPITIPIIISFMLAQYVAQDPDGTVAFWASMIPFTSPINMIVRIPYGVAWWELLLSMVLLIGGFVGTSWVAARIYRVGVLMYGKKPTFKELTKWVMYKG